MSATNYMNTMNVIAIENSDGKTYTFKIVGAHIYGFEGIRRLSEEEVTK